MTCTHWHMMQQTELSSQPGSELLGRLARITSDRSAISTGWVAPPIPCACAEAAGVSRIRARSMNAPAINRFKLAPPPRVTLHAILLGSHRNASSAPYRISTAAGSNEIHAVDLRRGAPLWSERQWWGCHSWGNIRRFLPGVLAPSRARCDTSTLRCVLMPRPAHGVVRLTR